MQCEECRIKDQRIVELEAELTKFKRGGRKLSETTNPKSLAQRKWRAKKCKPKGE